MRYISESMLRAAIRRLRRSIAPTSLGDFLIFKRAQVLSGGPSAEVTTGLGSPPFLAAHLEFAGLEPYFFPDPHSLAGLADPKIEYFIPFSDADTAGGYRTQKFPSNGPSDTVSRWASREHPPFTWIAGSARPKRYEYVARSGSELQQFFYTKSGSALLTGGDQRPHLADLSIWWFRGRDLDEVAEPSQIVQSQQLIDQCVLELGLTDVERTALFQPGLPNGWVGDTADEDRTSNDQDDEEPRT